MANLPDSAGLPDAANPRAVAYAHQQLKRMVKMGILPKNYGLPGEDVTATYRRVSSVLGARKQIIGLSQRNPNPAIDSRVEGLANPTQGAEMGQLLAKIQAHQGQQAPAAVGPMEAAAVPEVSGPPAAVGPMQGAAAAQAQPPHPAALQALLAALRPRVPGPVNPRQQLIAHLAQRIRAGQGPHISIGQPGSYF